MAGSFLVIDLLWIVLFVQSAYEDALGPIMRSSPNVASALVFYVGYIGGIYYLAVRPALGTLRFSTAVVNGAVLGALCYGTYALTSHALFEGWTATLVTIDTLWGASITALTAATGFTIRRRRS